ncbi:MAG: thioredoxin family protein [Thermoplasmata archaeon]|nr:thioredoxin family protein [Thermoplasmata archaeon]
MELINEEDKKSIKGKFANEMEKDVRILYFTEHYKCRYCAETKEILETLTELADGKIKLEIYEFEKEKELVEKYRINKIPATLVFGENEYKIRFFGIPSGYEFSTLLEDVIDASRGRTNLKENIKEEIRKIDSDVHIQVFVTPTCPYCPIAVHTAHQMAIENERITGDMVEVIEFPHLAQKYNVMGVPKIVINETREIVGAVPEEVILEEIKAALGY